MDNPYAAPRASTDVAPGGGPERVGFWPRFGAWLIDGVVIWVVATLISDQAAAWFPDYIADNLAQAKERLSAQPSNVMTPTMLEFFEKMARVSVGATVFGMLYALLEGMTGRSPAKMLLGLHIGNLTGGQAASGRLLGRMALKQLHRLLVLVTMFSGVRLFSQLAQFPFWVIFVGCFFVFARHRRALHDLAAGTAVYRHSDLTAAGP
jgi:uncharacterized RDD family membrane protein YckC